MYKDLVVLLNFTFSDLRELAISYSTSGDKKNIPTYEMKSDHENGHII